MTYVVRSPAAERDLEDVWLTIAADDICRRRPRIVRAIGAKIERLADHPRIGPATLGHPTSDAHAQSRGRISFSIETHPDTDEGPVAAVEIVRIVDGRRDLTNLL